jgi:hypothetical protein
MVVLVATRNPTLFTFVGLAVFGVVLSDEAMITEFVSSDDH